MDKAKKFLRKLSGAEQDEIDGILFKIEHGDVGGLDVKKLKGHKNLFRVRVGDVRIVFSQEGGNFSVVFIDNRGDSKYERF